MRSPTFFLLPISISALQIPSIFAPFYEPLTSLLTSNETTAANENAYELLKRDGNCPLLYNSCSTLAAADGAACCTQGSICTTDKAHAVACCPVGATCTGTLGAATGTTSAGGAVITGGTGTAAITNTGAAPTITGSVVPNAYFPFPIIANTYANSVACLSAYTACQSNYAACTADLQGGIFGVTIVAPAGGVTVSPTAQNLAPASATSICSSLSSQACGGLQTANCAAFGDGTTTTTTTSGGVFVIGTPKNGAERARQTVGCMAKAGVIAGVGLGLAGQIL